MTQQIAVDVANWLKGLNEKGGDIRDIRPIKVTFNVPPRKGVKGPLVSFYGAKYVQNNPFTKGMDAVVRGDKKEGDEHLDTRIYLVGVVPKFPENKRHGTSVVYRISGDEKDWYPSCHYVKDPKNWEQVKQYHPFESDFMFGRWDLPEAIDRYDESPCDRLPMTVEYLDT
jgi:hypothetical protein